MQELPEEQSITLQNVSVLSNNLLSATANQMARDMRFYAIVYVIIGAIYCLTIFGAIYGIPLIIYNLKLKDSADQFEEFTRTRDFMVLHKAMENQRKFFFFNKVIIIIGLVLTLLYFLFLVWFGTSMFFNMPDGNFA